MTSRLPTVEVNAQIATALTAGHPWVYKNHVRAGSEAPAGWVRVVAGGFAGFGIWDPRSTLALRLFSRRAVPDVGWFDARLREALELRRPLLADGRTTAYRLVSGEGDFLPGIVIDIYDRFAVIVLDSSALQVVIDDLVAALEAVLAPAGVLLRDRKSGGEPTLIRGEALPSELIVSENGLRLRVNLLAGQKTGLFLDHRDNRSFIERLAAGGTVLNLFAYSGAFSLYAVRAGARRVTSVDIAPAAMADARENFRLNGFDPEQHDFIVGDVFEQLEQARQRGDRYDLVIVDPPSFAHKLADVKQASKAYLKLNTLACRVVSAGGYLVAASCTARLNAATFREIVTQATDRAGVRSQIVHEAGHAADHPVSGAHPEGRYLKCVVARLHPRGFG